MRTFADTSSLYALLVANDKGHQRAKAAFHRLASEAAELVTSSFVLVETIALLQRRVGLSAVRDFQARLFPLLEVVWINRDWYRRGVERLYAEQSRHLSLVDCLSFEIMQALEIETAFACDRHFSEAGFTLL
ncbi:MAG TPA: PIN domain-containing protein [Desulfobacteraceae bacterium]|nr:PIN domain-containing protein [Deltaproteobacteria bacterium]MBW2356296.1 PIN domain-containing protein [Deltaproteobacteria bacterium]RLB98727.1 MAG: VapC toxin family PIN domain ribonuclease [Deltaproteobacteria bacterium]HDI60924.1 PIN domain-containing protein [Desulfobacteraceae bacterium]